MKKIGIVGWNTGDNSFGVTKPYIDYISKFGVPVILTPQHTEVEALDLLILPGGKDLLPSTYNARPSYFTGDPNPLLEQFDAIMLQQYIDADVPILGICRGAQRLWVHYGGQMDQHNSWHDQSKYNSDQCHEIVWMGEHSVHSKKLEKVNSRHHQTMDTKMGKSIPEELDVMAYAFARKQAGKALYYPGIVEIFKHRTKRIVGIQGHPEDMYSDDFTPEIINNFLEIEKEQEVPA